VLLVLVVVVVGRASAVREHYEDGDEDD